MSILIIGSGLVGSQIARLESEKGENAIILEANPRVDALSEILDVQKVKILQGDVLNLHDLYGVIKSHGVKKIIHTAANPLLTDGARERPYEAVRLNVMGTMNVLEASRRLDIEKVVFTSSSVIHSFFTEDPFGQRRPTTIYASTKLACEHLGLNYVDSYGLDFVACRFAAAIGPWKYGGGGGPTQMMKDLLEKSVRGEPVKVKSIVSEFVYSKDAARACVLAAAAQRGALKTRIYNIGMGKIHTAEEVKSVVEKLLPSAHIEILGSQSVIMVSQKTPMDPKAANEELGYKPEYPIERALEDYVAWLKATRKIAS